jgi:hypothetical protein
MSKIPLSPIRTSSIHIKLKINHRSHEVWSFQEIQINVISKREREIEQKGLSSLPYFLKGEDPKPDASVKTG